MKLTKQSFHKKIGKLCERFGGKPIEGHYTPAWEVETPKYGILQVTPVDNWIALRFKTYSTGKVYDSLLGRDFNGWSSKWNILIGGQDIYTVRNATLLELEWRLENVLTSDKKSVESLS